MKKKYAPKGSLIAALDIGTSKTACFIGRMLDDKGDFEVLGVGNYKSEGVRGGVITDLDSAEGVIRKAVHAAENMAADATKGYPLREIVVNVACTKTASYGRTVDIDIAGHDVTEKDCKAALKQAQDDVPQDSHTIIHTIPVDYRIDKNAGIKDPLGMVGQQMSADIHIVTADTPTLKNINNCTDRSHLDISAFCSSAYASGLSSLVEDEMDLGCTVIDIGGGVTSIAVFHAGAMVYSDAIPVGGYHVTNDIAAGLTTALSDAERLKFLYGCAMASNMDESELIDVPRLGEDENRKPNHVPRSLLIGIIQPRLEELFELVRASLKDSGLGSIVGRRVVLTGGTSQMAGIKDLAAHVLDKQIRVGKPIRNTGLPDAVNGPDFSTAAGMLVYAASHMAENSDHRLENMSAENLFQAIKHWLKENW